MRTDLWKTWTLIAAAGLLLGSVTLAYPRTALDTPTFFYVAQALREGAVLYRDVWDIKGPGVYVIYLLLVAVAKEPVLGLRIFDVLWQMATAFCLGGIALRVFGAPFAARAAGLLYLLIYYSLNYWHFGQPDGFLSLPMALAFLCLLRATKTDRNAYWLGGAALVGVVAAFKLPLALCGVSCLWAAWRLQPVEPASVLRRFALLAAGLGLFLGAVAIGLHQGSALGSFLTAQFVVAPQYATLWRSSQSLACLRERLLNPALGPLYIFAGMALLQGLLALRRKGQGLLPQTMLLLWAAAGAAVLLMHGAFFAYQFLPLAAPVSVLAAGLLLHGRTEWPQRYPARRAAITFLVVAACLPPVYRFADNLRFTVNALQKGYAPPPWQGAADFVRANSAPQDAILVWGNVPAIYMDAERRGATRFPYLLHAARAWQGADLRSQLWQDFEKRMPALVVVTKQQPQQACRASTRMDEWEAFQTSPRFQELIRTKYRQDYEDEDFLIYRLIAP